MNLVMRTIFAIVLLIALVVFVTIWLRSVMARPTRGVLQVPTGKTYVDVIVCDDKCLRPFKYGQAFRVAVVPGETELVNQTTGEVHKGCGALSYRGSVFGFADGTDQYDLVLAKFADKFSKVMVETVILYTDPEGHPVMRLNLPRPTWFKSALDNAKAASRLT